MQYPPSYELDPRSETRLFALDLPPYKMPWVEICNSTNNCAHEVFFKLNLEKDHTGRDVEEKEAPKYALRISFTPSVSFEHFLPYLILPRDDGQPPAQFDIEVLTPEQTYELFSKRAGLVASSGPNEIRARTRTMYARVRARDTGVRAPLDKTWHLFAPLIPPPSTHIEFHLILDPLRFGFIPKSIEQTIWAVVVSALVGLCSLRWVVVYLERLAVRIHSLPVKK
jgi:hypothetical protein